MTAKEDDLAKEGSVTAADNDMKVVAFPVKLDLTEPASSSNRRYVKVDKLSNFTEASEALVAVREALCDKIFVHESITTVSEVQKRFNYVKGCLTGDTVHQFASAMNEAWEELIIQAGEDPTTSPFDTDERCWRWLTTVPPIVPSTDKATKERNVHCRDFEDHVWWQLACLAWPEHEMALADHDHYVMTQIIKPFKWTVLQAVEREEQMFCLRDFLPGTGEDWANANVDHVHAKMDDDAVCEAQYFCLPDPLKLIVREENSAWKSLSKTDWSQLLKKAEKKDLRERQLAKKAKRWSARRSSDDDSSTEPRKRTGKCKRGDKSWQGEARVFQLCKALELDENVWKSHKTKDCRRRLKKLSKGVAGDCKKGQTDLKKAYKKQSKELKAIKKELKELCAMQKKDLKDSDDDDAKTVGSDTDTDMSDGELYD